MRSILRVLPLALALGAFAAAPAIAADNSDTTPGKHDTAKGAAAGAVVGHEMGSGHAVAGGVAGAAIGHHEKKKAERESAKQ